MSDDMIIEKNERFKNYLRVMADRAGNSPSPVENLQAVMWREFLPAALHFWTTAGCLEQIAALIAEPSDDDDEETDDEAA